MRGTGHKPGSFVVDARETTVYHVQPDGSWRKLPMTVEEFMKLREKALAGEQAPVDSANTRNY